MSIKVYNWEKVDRNKRRYIIFSITLILIIWLSLRKQNIVWVVIIFFILWAYFYYSTLSNQTIKITINPNHIAINNKIFIWEALKAYCVEIEKSSQKIKNIILITEKQHYIYTFNDSQENIKDFLSEIDQNLTLVSEYNQWWLEKLARFLKL